MTITLRSTKGSALTHAELDGNFSDLDARAETATSTAEDLQTQIDQLRETNILTPPIITASQNNYNPTDLAGASILRVATNAADYSLTGLAGGAEGRTIILMNVGANYFFLEEESASSTEANRFLTENASWATIFPGSVAILTYDSTSSRWRVANGRPGASTATMEAAQSSSAFVSPAFLGRHPAAIKCWGSTTGGGTPVLAVSYNVAGIADTDVGKLTVTIATDFSSANWSGTASPVCTTNANRMVSLVSKTAGTVVLECSSAATTLADPGVGYDWQFAGDQ